MKYALLQGTDKLLSVESFLDQYGLENEVRKNQLSCPACSEPVFPCGAANPQMTSHFKHYQNQECVLSNRVSDQWIKTNNWDFERGQKIRECLSGGDSLKKLYTFCNELCGKSGRLGIDQFREMIEAADRRNIWCYKDIPLWSVPYILLALKDFTGYGKKLKTPFVFRFVLKEKKPKDIEKIWEGARFHLHRIFEGGKTMKFPEGNPYPVTRENWEAYSKDYQWLGEEKYRNLLRGLESAFDKK